MRIPVAFRHSNIPASAQLESFFHSTWVSSLVFKEIEPNTYAFREKFSEFRFFRYSPIMHGLLFFDFDKGEVVVKGFANWFALCFSLVWLGGVAQSSDLIITLVFVLFFALFMGLLYSIQYYRFSNVARFAAHTWKRKYLRDGVGV
jgi:hypothetical protein